RIYRRVPAERPPPGTDWRHRKGGQRQHGTTRPGAASLPPCALAPSDPGRRRGGDCRLPHTTGLGGPGPVGLRGGAASRCARPTAACRQERCPAPPGARSTETAATGRRSCCPAASTEEGEGRPLGPEERGVVSDALLTAQGPDADAAAGRAVRPDLGAEERPGGARARHPLGRQ